MKQDHQAQADRLTEALELSPSPHRGPPSPTPYRTACRSSKAPSPRDACSGQEAAARTFATTAAHHALCSIGIHTHNLSGAPASQPEELGAALEAMIGLDYVREEEVAAIPVLERQAKHAVYGPLREFPLDPAVVLLFVDARQGLVLSEAVERVDGGGRARDGPPRLRGHPARGQPRSLGHEPRPARSSRARSTAEPRP